VLVSGKRRLVRLVLSAVAVGVLFGWATTVQAAPPQGLVRFSAPSLFPSFGPKVEDYVVRCQDAPITVQAHAAGGWEVAIAGGSFRSGDFSQTVPLRSGQAFVIAARKGAERFRYHVRCLPNNFPTYTFTRHGAVSPQYFVVTRNDLDYAMIFNNRGVPIWWVRAPTWNARVLGTGNVIWYSAPTRRFEVHRLDGKFLRAVATVGPTADGHDVQFLPNGDSLVSGQVLQEHVDASAFGKPSDSTVKSADLQQVTREGQLVWRWNTFDHISLAETGRWWNAVPTNQQPYDIVHWNSIQAAGNSVIASFRNLDAVYKINKGTGEIEWKLGGTNTPESLTVVGDLRADTLGAQHDARLLPDGTLTVFDNATGLPNPQPRAVRFSIDEQAGTATLLESITDPAVPTSQCCGSARRLSNGDWLINWAQADDHPIAGYKPNGDRTFFMTFNPRSSYRAEPVPAGILTAADLRAAMTKMCSSAAGCD
jgi:hypothetical protein